MPPIVTAAAIGGVATMAVGGMSSASASETNEANMEIAHDQMDFQERMFKNRHTYEVEDLRRAGLNPILSANSAASAPMGASAVMQNPVEPLAASISSSARAITDSIMGKTMINTEKSKQEVNKSIAEVNKANAEIVRADAKSRSAASDFEGKETWSGKYLLGPIRAIANALGGMFHASASTVAHSYE